LVVTTGALLEDVTIEGNDQPKPQHQLAELSLEQLSEPDETDSENGLFHFVGKNDTPPAEHERNRVRRCTLCGADYTEAANSATACQYHPGTWCDTRPIRLRYQRACCQEKCANPKCDKPCIKAAHGKRIQHRCADTRCLELCGVPTCGRACKVQDHFHALQPNAHHTCGESHPCEETCTAPGCSRKCKHEATEVNHLHSCNSKGCDQFCSYTGCKQKCSMKEHMHMCPPINMPHWCGNVHACAEMCSGPGCKALCHLSREEPHALHSCGATGCLCKCSVANCNRPCANMDHLHGAQPLAHHNCGQQHPCPHFCDAPGCNAPCTKNADMSHDLHDCSNSGCQVGCDVPGCKRKCSSKLHFHGQKGLVWTWQYRSHLC
jgi:hypothetical protein